MRKGSLRICLLGICLVIVFASIAYAATFYADMEYPYLVSGYSELTVDGDEAEAYAQTQTQLLAPYDELRAHCQLWEDGHYRYSQTKVIETFGGTIFQVFSSVDPPYGEYYAPIVRTSIYDGNWWVYGVHRGECDSFENDITSDGWVYASKRSEPDLVEWNEPSMNIAESITDNTTQLVPWRSLSALKTILGRDVGGRFMWTVIDTVVPLLEEGDLLPAVAVNQEAGTALVVVPKQVDGYSLIELELPKQLSVTPPIDSR